MDEKRNAGDDNVIHLHSTRASRVAGHVIGHLVGLSAHGELLVTYPANQHGPLIARSTVALSAAEVRDLVETGREMLITFEGEASDRPIVVGVMQPAIRNAEAALASSDVTVDDKVLVLEGQERVELRCGKASVVLTRDGKVLLNGAYISAHAAGAYRIRGGSVEIN